MKVRTGEFSVARQKIPQMQKRNGNPKNEEKAIRFGDAQEDSKKKFLEEGKNISGITIISFLQNQKWKRNYLI